MPGIRRLLKTLLPLASVLGMIAGPSLTAQAGLGRPGAKRHSLKKAGPKAGAGAKVGAGSRSQSLQGSRGARSSGMTSSQSNRSGTSGGNQTSGRGRK